MKTDMDESTVEKQHKLIDRARQLRAQSYGKPLGAQIATIFMWTFALLVTGTVLGIWIKLFWIGWVFAR